jgi:UDP-N-acetylmuramoyl-L-alanyl-D-glutamate--2,6-diaminopimelate ligase
MIIDNILKEFSQLKLLKGNTNNPINYIWADSRKIQKNDIFVMSDEFTDINFLTSSIENGSSTCLISKTSEFLSIAKEKFENVISSDSSSNQMQGYIASFILDHPSKKLEVIAITGTNGKTSLTHILYHFARSLGIPSGLIGTIHTKYNDVIIETGYTTPEASSLQLQLRDMLKEGIQFVFLEASSHGLKLGRTNGLQFRAALFTNITKDHLDFHETMDDYLKSKFRIFTLLEESTKENKFGIINLDAEGGLAMKKLILEHSLQSKINFLGKTCNYEIDKPRLSINGSEFIFKIKKPESTFHRNLRVRSNLLGGFNIQNVALAISCWVELNIATERITTFTESIPRIPGRFDIYYSPDKDRIAIVDYAHTPDALLNILQSAKELNPKRLICLFGCGGDRDRTKRPEMAAISERMSDLVIFTSDNPRTEDPELILNDIEKGFQDKSKIIREIDRKNAIQIAIDNLQEGDILAVCGKGHENYQIIGKEKFHFDDGEEIEKAW